MLGTGQGGLSEGFLSFLFYHSRTPRPSLFSVTRQPPTDVDPYPVQTHKYRRQFLPFFFNLKDPPGTG